MNLEYAVRVCICTELRACEQRAARNGVEITYVWDQSEVDGLRAQGYAAALDAAETAAFEALKERMFMADCSPNTMRAPLLAIRALKEKE
jgi:hypothetical protein